LRLLRAEGVRYLLVGGWAVIYYGYPRPTNDFDIWVAVDPKNADGIVRVLRKFGLDLSLPPENIFANGQNRQDRKRAQFH